MFSSKDKLAKSAALQKLMDLMDQGDHEELKGLKKPSVTGIDVTAMPKGDEEDSDVPSPMDHDGDEPTDDEKAQIATLYNKFCK